MTDALASLARSGGRLAVLTNKPRSFSEDILAGLGVRSLFAEVVGGDDGPTRKPDPTGLERLVQRAGCARRSVVLVGDSRVDLATAAAAGIDSCAVTWGFAPEEELRATGATHWARRPADLLALAR
jgi:phosphoglycolate phosphatase